MHHLFSQVLFQVLSSLPCQLCRHVLLLDYFFIQLEKWLISCPYRDGANSSPDLSMPVWNPELYLTQFAGLNSKASLMPLYSSSMTLLSQVYPAGNLVILYHMQWGIWSELRLGCSWRKRCVIEATYLS